MRALRVTGPGVIEVADVPAPAPESPDSAVVAVERAGVCGTDVKIATGAIPVDYPRILGHELVGVVERAAVQGAVPEGTHVLVNPSVSCGRCRQCRGDRENLCPQGALLGRDADGGFAERIVVPDKCLHPIPPSVSAERSALLQVLGVCVHAQRTAEAFPGQSAAVIGLGVTGLLMVQLLRARGVERIVGITRSESKRNLAERFGATATAEPAKAAAAVADVTDGAGADIVVECVGSAATYGQAVEFAALGATVVLFGTVTTTEGGLPFYDMYHKELTLHLPRAALPRDYDTAVDLVAAGSVQVDDLLSVSFTLEEGQQAFDALQSGAGLLKVTLETV